MHAVASQPPSLFYLPFRPALDANGIVAPGARLFFFLTQTSIPQKIYADAALTIELENPVGANAAGVWPSIYMDPALTYRVVLKDQDGVTLNEVDPYRPGVAGEGEKGDTGPANSTYTTLAGLKAAAVSNASYIFAPPSGSDGGAAAGTFLYQTAGAPYTADGVNVIKLDAVPLSTGALVRQGAQSLAYASPVAIGAPQGQDEKNLTSVDVYDALTLSMRAAFRSGSRSYDAGPALQAIMDYAQGANSQADAAGGVELQWREGVYVTSTGLTNRFRADNSIIDDNDLRRMNMRGGGSANTALIYTGPNDGVAYDVRGVNEGPGRDLYHVVKGMRMIRFPLNSRTATGFRARYVADLHVEDLMIYGFATGALWQDVLGVSADRLWVLANDVGLRMGLVDFTNPNVCRFTNGRFSGNQSLAAHIIRGANVGFHGTRFEANGADGSDTAITMLYEGGPPEGAHALTVENCYFENNRGVADISIGWSSPYKGTVAIRDNTFHRAFPVGGAVGTERYVQHHIDTAVVGSAASSGSKLTLIHDGNGYKTFGSYTPSPLRSVLRVQSPVNTIVREGQNEYQNDVERPETNNGPFIGATYPVASVTVAADGTYDLDPLFTINVASVSKTGTGVYRVLYKTQPRQPLRVNANATLFNGTGMATISGRANEYIEVTTLDAAGNAADRAFTLNALGSF